MRFIGKLTTWNEDRGFGFIRPAEGGQDIFVHVSDLPHGFRPSPHDALTFEVSLNPQGKKKAMKVQLVTVPAAPTARVEHTPERRWSASSSASSSGGAFTKLVLLVVIAGAGWAAYTRFMGPASSFLMPGIQEQRSRPGAVALPLSRAQVFSCDGRKHCSQMTSCEEATFFLKNCPGTKMDGDHDGVPCEEQHCRL